MSTQPSDPAPGDAGTAIPSDAADTAPLDAAALQADLASRVARLDQLVAGFDLVLERFKGADVGAGASAATGPAIFENFDDAGASNEALDLLFASSTDARRDLAALRRDVPALLAANRIDGQQLMLRVRSLGSSAANLAGRFEDYGRSISLTVSPRTAGGVGRLNEFVALVVRALVQIVDVADGLRRNEDRHAGAPASPPASAPEEHRPSVAAAVSLAIAGAPWRLLRRRRTRLMIESAGVAVVGVAILVSVLNQGGSTPGSAVGSLSPSAGSDWTSPPGVAIASGSPNASPASPAPTEGGASATPTTNPSSAPPAPTLPPSTPRPTQRPAATPHPPAGITQFGNRAAAAAAVIDGLLDTITTAVQGADLPAAASAADEVGATATRERSWLQSHPAAACYQAIQESAMAAYGELIVTATGIEQNAEAGDANAIHPQVGSAHGDVSTLRQAGNKAVAACA